MSGTARNTPLPVHGTRARYQRSCRCAPCTEANAVYQRAYLKDRKRTVPAETTRGLVLAVLASGETAASVAARVGYSESFVSRLVLGRVRRVRMDTAEDFASLRVEERVAVGA